MIKVVEYSADIDVPGSLLSIYHELEFQSLRFHAEDAPFHMRLVGLLVRKKSHHSPEIGSERARLERVT